jgi:mono/diheme cytochrome c family protein
MKQTLLKYLPTLFFIGLVAVFIYNLLEHGRIEHPGFTVYKNQCAQCHSEDGNGIRELVPPINDADFLNTYFDSIPCWLTNGLNHAIVVKGITYDQPMYPPKVDEIQIANVMNYLRDEYKLKRPTEVNSIWVKEQIKGCK